MNHILPMFEDCSTSPAYIHLPQDQAAYAALRDKINETVPDHTLRLELDSLTNAYASTSAQEGFVNGWAWAQATADECLSLRKLPELTEDYGPEKRCGNCRWFVQHYRYTGTYPWYQLVGCGHCMAPKRSTRRPVGCDPVLFRCSDWKERDA